MLEIRTRDNLMRSANVTTVPCHRSVSSKSVSHDLAKKGRKEGSEKIFLLVLEVRDHILPSAETLKYHLITTLGAPLNLGPSIRNN